MDLRSEKDKRKASDPAEMVCVSLLTLCCKWTGLPQGPAEVCRMCGFILEIILLLISSRFLPINNRSSVAIQSIVLMPFLAVWTYSTRKREKKRDKNAQIPHIQGVQGIAAVFEEKKKKLFR